MPEPPEPPAGTTGPHFSSASTSASTPSAMTSSTDQEPDKVVADEPTSPTASHALASETVRIAPGEDPEQHPQGAAQMEHDISNDSDIEVKNLGWNKEASEVPRPVVGGLRNEELWTLVRRFDKQVFHVKRIEERPLADLDMNIADEEQFSPEKLRAQLERLYMVVLVSLFSFWKHIVRLRSWREQKRSAVFLGVYVVAWVFDLLVPTITAFLMVLILFPPSREFCFPPVPPSLIDPKTGGIQKPPAGLLASEGSVTGAPEKHEGEAVEQEAHSFVNSISTLVVSTAAGKHPEADPHEDQSAPDPTQLTEYVSDARDKTKGNDPSLEHNKAKKPISTAVWDKARPTMHLVADVVDTWERFGNALSPVTPFPRRRPRAKLAACLLPVFLSSLFLTPYMVTKATTFGVGFGFFGDPIITPSLEYLNRKIPDWKKLLELRHTLLKGIPTNAQLTITLLRVGERAKAPIPPPLDSSVPAPVEPHPKAKENLERLGEIPSVHIACLRTNAHAEGVTEDELHQAVTPDDGLHEEYTEPPRKKMKKSERILNLLRNTTAGGVHTALTADRAKAAAGRKHALARRGAVRTSSTPPTGPVCFPARYNGEKGHAYITETSTSPALSWTSDINDPKKTRWSVAVGDVVEVKKVGGLGWKSKIVVGWALGREIVDGLLVKTEGGEEWHLTAVEMRDELFNRLIAMGTQMWESW